jgi:hypothetical protein
MLTPEQAQDLVDWAGSLRAAGRATGVKWETIRYWRTPELSRERDRRRRPSKYRNRRRRKEAGLCRNCPEPLLTETLCWTCASKHAESTALSRI